MVHGVGSRSALFSGVFSAGRPVDVMYLVSGNEDGEEVRIRRVPFAM
jgi:hypothetical protein